MPTQVLLGSRQRLFTEGLAEIIAKIPEAEVVAVAFNGEEVLNRLQEVTCQVAIIDVGLTTPDGYMTSRLIKQFYPTVRVILLAENHRSSAKVLEANVYGYLLKSDSRESLNEAIQKVGAGLYYNSVFSTNVLGSKAERAVSPRKIDASPVVSPMHLTRREVEIITLVARGYSSAKIADVLKISTQTAITHRRNILRKLNINSTTELVKYAFQNGLAD